MTQGQILTFYIIASGYYATYSGWVADLVRIGDKQAAEKKVMLILLNKWLKIIHCYDPAAENNCLTPAQIYSIMERIAKELGICGDIYTLEESDTTCCDPMAGKTILNP